jgi:hypothetical protein
MLRTISHIRLVILVPLALLVAVFAASAATAAPPIKAPKPDKDTAKAGQAAPATLPPGQADKQKKQDALLPVAQELSDQANAAGSDIAGVTIDVDGGTVDLYRKNPGKALGLSGAPTAGVKIQVHEAKFSRKELLDAADQVTRDAQALGQQQVTVEAVGPKVDGSGIDVTVFAADGSDLTQATDVLKGKYGALIHKVNGTDTKTSDKGDFVDGFRYNDFAPWYGGDRITDFSVGCSSGFAATYNGAPAMLTAAHCGGVGGYWYNGPGTTGGHRYMGQMVYSDGGTDVAAIGVSSYSTRINVGYDPTAPWQINVGSWASPIVGQYLCQSGAYTGERCSLYVVDTYQYVCRSYFLWWCTSWQGPLADVIGYSAGVPVVGHGDSGGPVYRYSYYNYSTGTWEGVAEGLVHAVLTPNAAAAYPAYAAAGDTQYCSSPFGWSYRCAPGFSFAHMPGY